MTHRSQRVCSLAACTAGAPHWPVRRYVLVAALPAVAHTELIGSPADGATLTTPPAEVLLEFSEAVQAEFGQVAVLDDADVHHEQGNPQIVGKGDAGSRRALGTYRISYRVGSADGHPITGTLTFTVTAAAAETTPPDAPPTTPTPVATSVDPHEGMNHADQPSESDHAGGVRCRKRRRAAVCGRGVAVAAVLGAVLYVALDRRRPPDEPTAEEDRDSDGDCHAGIVCRPVDAPVGFGGGRRATGRACCRFAAGRRRFRDARCRAARSGCVDPVGSAGREGHS